MTTDSKPGNLDQHEVFEASMQQLGWTHDQLSRDDETGYANPGVQFGWNVWKVARSAALIETALWYKTAGWMLDEDDIPQAIMELNKPTL